MKFDDLYNKVFIQEQDAEVADPANFDDVEGVPVPEAPVADPGSPSPVGAGDAGTLTDYIRQLEEFANKLNSADGSSLQSMVANLDKPATPFDGIRSRTSSDIEAAAKTLRSVSEKLKNFVINAAKK